MLFVEYFFYDWVLDNNAKLNPEVGKGKFGNYEDWFGHGNVWKEGSNWIDLKLIRGDLLWKFMERD